jgi:hypothetical protein
VFVAQRRPANTGKYSHQSINDLEIKPQKSKIVPSISFNLNHHERTYTVLTSRRPAKLDFFYCILKWGLVCTKPRQPSAPILWTACGKSES